MNDVQVGVCRIEHHDNIKAARAAARASGWRHTNDQDVCPGCVNSDA